MPARRDPSAVLRADSRALRLALLEAAGGLPGLDGMPIAICAADGLTVSRGKLHVGTGQGMEVSAASYLVERRMVLDGELLGDPAELRRILVHELFHFVWRRLGNQTRREYHVLIADEFRKRARGELGWSAERRKNELSMPDLESNSRSWRQYLCESFCDSAAWYFGTAHPEHTLARRHCARRKAFFDGLTAGGTVRV